jgi:putative protease
MRVLRNSSLQTVCFSLFIFSSKLLSLNSLPQTPNFLLQAPYPNSNLHTCIMINNRIELMSPAGSFEALQAAIQNGADSIYFGVDQLNMRARATMNFTADDLPEIASRCQEKNIRTYLTLNTIVYDHDLSVIKKIVDQSKAAGISAIIASDQAVINYAFTQKMPVHASTQLNITNIETVKFYAHFCDVMVLSRELSLRQVKSICEQIVKEEIKGPSGNLIKIEIFGHGALCMAVSGKCYLSLHTQNSSANRGACNQNCRKAYKVIDLEDGHELEIDNEYIMSPQDLCTIDFLDQVVATGTAVLKLEGRGRAPEYVAAVTRCYRQAIDSIYDETYSQEKIEQWMAQLEKVYNRGLWSGYYLGLKLGEWTNQSGSSATQKKVYIGKGLHYYSKAQVGEFLIEAQSIKKGDSVFIIGPTSGVIEAEIEELRVDNQIVEEAKRGQECTFKVSEIVRASDRLYKVIPA